MTTENYELLDLVANSQNPENIINYNNTLLDAIATPNFVTKNLTAPPGDAVNGSVYIPASIATGDWAGHENKLAYYNNGWSLFIEPIEGMLRYNLFDDLYYTFDGNNWVTADEFNIYALSTQTNTTSITITKSNANIILICNNAGNINITLPSTATEALPLGFSFDIIRRNTGTVTVLKQASDTIESISSYTKIAQYGRAKISKIVDGNPNVWNLSGDLEA